MCDIIIILKHPQKQFTDAACLPRIVFSMRRSPSFYISIFLAFNNGYL